MPRIYKPAVGPSDNKVESPAIEIKAPKKPEKPSEKKDSDES